MGIRNGRSRRAAASVDRSDEDRIRGRPGTIVTGDPASVRRCPPSSPFRVTGRLQDRSRDGSTSTDDGAAVSPDVPDPGRDPDFRTSLAAAGFRRSCHALVMRSSRAAAMVHALDRKASERNDPKDHGRIGDEHRARLHRRTGAGTVRPPERARRIRRSRERCRGASMSRTCWSRWRNLSAPARRALSHRPRLRRACRRRHTRGARRGHDGRCLDGHRRRRLRDAPSANVDVAAIGRSSERLRDGWAYQRTPMRSASWIAAWMLREAIASPMR